IIGPGTMNSGRTRRFVRIYRNLSLGCFLNDIVIMPDHALAVVRHGIRNDKTYIAGLYSIVPEFIHIVKGNFELAFVLGHGSRGFVMHDKPYVFFLSVVRYQRDVKIRIRRYKIKNVLPTGAIPVFPSGVPTLDENGIETVLVGKIDVSLCILGRGAVSCLSFRIFMRIGTLGGGKIPSGFSHVHFPPDANVFHWLYP